LTDDGKISNELMVVIELLKLKNNLFLANADELGIFSHSHMVKSCEKSRHNALS
jgi:hypothetical protein